MAVGGVGVVGSLGGALVELGDFGRDEVDEHRKMRVKQSFGNWNYGLPADLSCFAYPSPIRDKWKI
jgi:hypothetical protein